MNAAARSLLRGVQALMAINNKGIITEKRITSLKGKYGEVDSLAA